MENRELTSELEAVPVSGPQRLPAPLESLFPELRALPRQPPRREILPGLAWKSVLNPGILAFFPLLVLFLVLPFFVASMVKQQAAARRTATAKVVQVERFGADQIFVKYRFDVGGRAYSGGVAGVADSLMSLVKVGDPLRVGFEAGQMQKSVPDFNQTPRGSSPNEFPWPFLVVFPAMGLFVFTPFLVPQLKSHLRVRRLFAQGTLTTGKLVFVKQLPQLSPQHTSRTLTLIYEWKDDQNQLQHGSMKCDNAWLAAQLHSGSPVVVAYNPQKPGQNVILEPFVA